MIVRGSTIAIGGRSLAIPIEGPHFSGYLISKDIWTLQVKKPITRHKIASPAGLSIRITTEFLQRISESV